MFPTSASLEKTGAVLVQPAENLLNISRIKKSRYRPETGRQIMPEKADDDRTSYTTSRDIFGRDA